MKITTLTVGQMVANCFLVEDPEFREILIIDPGEDANYIAEQIVKSEGVPKAIVATHGHFDHILGAYELQNTFRIPFWIHEEDRFLVHRMQETAEHFLGRHIAEHSPSIDKTITDGEEITIGKTTLSVIHTPGHTPGSICLYNAKENVLFTGDTIFAGGAVGRTDFSYSRKDLLELSLNKIMQLGTDIHMYPGHGEETTIQAERKHHMV